MHRGLSTVAGPHSGAALRASARDALLPPLGGVPADGEGEPEGGPPTHGRLDPDLTPVALDDLLANGETDPSAGPLAPVQALEDDEDPVVVLGIDADPVVA